MQNQEKYSKDTYISSKVINRSDKNSLQDNVDIWNSPEG